MNSPSEDLKDLITQSGGVGDFGVDVFITHTPPTPNECVTIYDTGGFDPDLATDLDYPTALILIRGSVGGYKAAYAKALTIKSLLHGVSQEVISDSRYLLIRCNSDISFLGLDDKNRPELSINFIMMRTASS